MCVICIGESVNVYKGHLQLVPRLRRGHEVVRTRVVAVKVLKKGAGVRGRCDLMNDASIMAQLNNPNVLSLEGVVLRSQPIMIVTEFMNNSSLDLFLQARLHVNQSLLIYHVVSQRVDKPI